MALYHGFSGRSGAQDLVTRLDDTLHWGIRHWRSFALAGTLLLTALGGYAGYTALRQHKALAASTALYALQTKATGAATEHAAEWLALAEQYPGTLPGQLARFHAVRRALDAGDVAKAREMLQPLLAQRRLPPLIEEAAYQWLAVSHERASDWTEASRWYQRILGIQAPEVDHPRAVRNAVRVLRLAGTPEAAQALLNASALARPGGQVRTDPTIANTVETERLWLIAGE